MFKILLLLAICCVQQNYLIAGEEKPEYPDIKYFGYFEEHNNDWEEDQHKAYNLNDNTLYRQQKQKQSNLVAAVNILNECYTDQTVENVADPRSINRTEASELRAKLFDVVNIELNENKDEALGRMLQNVNLYIDKAFNNYSSDSKNRYPLLVNYREKDLQEMFTQINNSLSNNFPETVLPNILLELQKRVYTYGLPYLSENNQRFMRQGLEEQFNKVTPEQQEIIRTIVKNVPIFNDLDQQTLAKPAESISSVEAPVNPNVDSSPAPEAGDPLPNPLNNGTPEVPQETVTNNPPSPTTTTDDGQQHTIPPRFPIKQSSSAMWFIGGGIITGGVAGAIVLPKIIIRSKYYQRYAKSKSLKVRENIEKYVIPGFSMLIGGLAGGLTGWGSHKVWQ